MNSKISNIILICSLVFNLTFISVVVYTNLFRVEEQKLFNEERCNKEPYTRGKHHPRVMVVHREREEFFDLKNNFLNKLSQPDFKETELRAALNILIEKQTEMEKIIGNDLIELRKNMSNEEARKFFLRLHNKKNQPTPKPRRK